MVRLSGGCCEMVIRTWTGFKGEYPPWEQFNIPAYWVANEFLTASPGFLRKEGPDFALPGCSHLSPNLISLDLHELIREQD